MLGKQKCKILKEIRQRIADENDIPYVTRECTHKGDCKGTCPKCESELRYLEEQLQKRQSLGKRVAVAALCTGLAFSGAGCDAVYALDELFGGSRGEMAGDVVYVSPTPEVDVTEGLVPYEDVPEGEEDPYNGQDAWDPADSEAAEPAPEEEGGHA